MVQHTILSLLQNCEKYGVSIEKIVEKIAHNPAIIFKVNKRGFLREGYYADIVLIDTNTQLLLLKSLYFTSVAGHHLKAKSLITQLIEQY